MMETGRVCVKIAGRDAGKKCVIVERVNDCFVIIDGNVKRKRCNIRHLEPLDTIIKINDSASSSEVRSAMREAGIDVEDKQGKKRAVEKTARPKKALKQKKPAKEGKK